MQKATTYSHVMNIKHTKLKVKADVFLHFCAIINLLLASWKHKWFYF